MSFKRIAVLIWGILAVAILGLAQTDTTDRPLRTGKEVFQSACINCHGPDGKGQPQTFLGFEPPATFPDFSDCPTSTPEIDMQWRAIINNGGAARGFSVIMPSFREALTSDQIEMVIGYLRSLCKDSSWPRGEFNLPRPLYTEKAFPENETVFTGNSTVNKDGSAGGSMIYEKRFGPRTNVELILPFSMAQNPTTRTWYAGAGDVSIEAKQALYANLKKGMMLTGAIELTLPSGDANRGLGIGTPIPELFLSYAQLMPRESFIQLQGGIELPTDTSKMAKEGYWRGAVGKTLRSGGGLGRAWTPMVEFLAAREIDDGAKVEWSVVPEMQVTLSQRQHIRANFGVNIPTNMRDSRATQVAFYLLWDWFDGGFFDGWRPVR